MAGFGTTAMGPGVHVGFADDDRTGGKQSFGDGGFVLGKITFQNQGAGGCGHADGKKIIFDGDWNSERFFPAGDQFVDRFRLFDGVFVDIQEGIQLVVVAIDAVKVVFNDINGTKKFIL